MFRDLLGNFDELGILKVATMLMFFGVFVGIIIYTLRVKKSSFDHMAQLPLDSDMTDANDREIHGG